MMPAPRALDRFVRMAPRGCAAFAVIAGALALSGWLADVRPLTGVIGSMPPMVANTAVLSILAGIALWGLAREPIARRWHRIAWTCAILVCAISGATALEYAIGVDLGIDRVLPHEPGAWPAGRPSPQSASAFLLLGGALLMLDRTIRARRLADYFAIAALVIAVGAMVGYLVGAPAMYGIPAHLPNLGMSLVTALAVVGLAFGIIVARVQHGIVAIVLARDAGGALARRLLAGMLVFVPVAIALLAGAHANLYTFPLAASLVALFALAESGAIIVSTARRLGRSDAALRATEARVRALVDQAADAIFVADLDGRYIEVNDAACRMLGYAPGELLGKTIADLIPAEDVPRLAAAKTQLLGGDGQLATWKLRRHDGSYVPVEVSAKILVDGRWQAIARDITERTRVEAALARASATERALRAEVEALMGAVSQTVEALPRLDLELVLKAIATQARALTTARYVAVAIGTEPDRPFDRWVDDGMPEDIKAAIGRPPRAVGVFAEVVRTGKVLRTGDITQHPAYRGIPAAHPAITSFLGIPIRHRDQPLGTLYLANKHDATEFSDDDVRIVTALADRVGAAIESAKSYASEARMRAWLQSIIDQLPEGVIVLDQHGHVSAMNRAVRALSVPRGAATDPWGNPALFDIRDLDQRPLAFEDLPIVRALRTGETIHQELLLRQTDGRMLPVVASAGPIRDERDAITGAIVVVTDASERKEAERTREEWVAVVAHDLRQPLNTILLSSDRLKALATDERERATIGRIRAAAWRLNRMIEDLLDAARITAHQLAIEPRITDVVELVRTAIENARLANPDVELRLVSGERELAWVDGERVEQVLGNLISNAVKYGAAGTPITVEVTGGDRTIEVAVSNAGPPIPPDELARLFARFSRTHGARTSRIPGIGLGLYICKGLIEAHGGRIWAESHDGITRFRFTLPRPPELEPAG